MQLRLQGFVRRCPKTRAERVANVVNCRSRTQDRLNFIAIALTVTCLVSAPTMRAEILTLPEALDATNLVWTTGGDVDWFVQTINTHDGFDAVSSGLVVSNQTCWLETTVVGPQTASFWVKQQPYVSLCFTVNGIGPCRGHDVGVPNGWFNTVIDLGEGTNVLRWSVTGYYPDSSGAAVVLDEFTLTPPRALAIGGPSDRTLFSGEQLYLSASVIGTPPFRYQWVKDNNPLPNATNNYFSIYSTTTNDSGVYSVVVSDDEESVTSRNSVVTVQPPSAPLFVVEPSSAAAYSGQTMSWWTSVHGSPPFAYQWRKDGNDLPGATNYILALTNLSMSDAGSYTVVVTNEWGSIESSNAVLVVIASAAPVITRHPRSLELAEGVSTWLLAEATGTPDPVYVWSKPGTVEPEPPPTFSIIPRPLPVGAPGPSKLSLPNVTTNDAGLYHVTATNLAGQVVSREALVTVLPPLALVGFWWQGAADIFYANGLAYVAQPASGVGILSVNGPWGPVMMGGFQTAGTAEAVWVTNGWAFVACGSAGLQVFSVTNTRSPVLVSTLETDGEAQDLVLRSNQLFVANGYGGLLVMDISDPAAPVVLGRWTTNFYLSRICISGDRAYVGSPSALCVVDISDPSTPVELGRLNVWVRDVDAQGNLLFVVDGAGLQIIDASRPDQLELLGQFSPANVTRNTISSVRVINDLAYLAGSKLWIVNVRDPTNPVPVAEHLEDAGADCLWVDDYRVFMADADAGLWIIYTPFSSVFDHPLELYLVEDNGFRLQIFGRRGDHYAIESTETLSTRSWQALQTVFLTNVNALIDLPAAYPARFFRVRQVE